MNSFFHEAVEENPIIAAVKNMDDLKICCSLEDIRVVFILFGDVCSIREIVQQIKDSGKVAMVHIDLISGLSSKDCRRFYPEKYRSRWNNFHKSRID